MDSKIESTASWIYVLSVERANHVQASHSLPGSSDPNSCPTTQRAGQPFIPRSSYPANPSPGVFWFGSSKLWTSPRINGTWSGLAHYTPESATFRQKLFWWRQGYDWLAEPDPPLKVTGKWLDAPAPTLASSHDNGSFRQEDRESFIGGRHRHAHVRLLANHGPIRHDELTYVVNVVP